MGALAIDPLEFLIDTLPWKLIWNPDQMKMDQIFKGGKSQFRACLHYLFTCTHLLAQAQVFHCLWTNRKQQSWTKVLTNLSKTNAFYQHPSIISKSIFFVDSQTPLSPFSMLKYTPWTPSCGYNIERGRGGRNVTVADEKLTRSTKQVFFGECLYYVLHSVKRSQHHLYLSTQ